MLPQILFQPAPENTTQVMVQPGSYQVLSQLSKQENDYLQARVEESGWAMINYYSHQVFVVGHSNPPGSQSVTDEKLRKTAAQVYKQLTATKTIAVELTGPLEALGPVLEGLLLSSYTFEKYKSKKSEDRLAKIYLLPEAKQGLNELICRVEGTAVARTLVNEPVSFLTAPQLSEEIKRLGDEVGFSVEVLEEGKIQSLKMGGLLAVNAGSIDPPTFNILEYKGNSQQGRPLVLVGKGVVYDTGGLSIKPTAGSMDMMKSDMAGAAAVIGAIYAIAKAELPVHIVGLVPATDNRPGENAVAPGDVITQFGGTTVEVLNTDAEGRLILADALVYAQKYDPELVIDLATLTGAAARAIGPEGIVYMGTAAENTKLQLEQSGHRVYERLVEFPLWEEYAEQLKSNVADLTNLGGPNAGAITAGMFLKHFTHYPWLHLDIAGPAYATKPHTYKPAGGSGVGVRLLFQFVKDYLAS